MRILVHCTRCLQELEQKGVIPKEGSFDSSVVTFLADFGDQFVARGTCPMDINTLATSRRSDTTYFTSPPCSRF